MYYIQNLIINSYPWFGIICKYIIFPELKKESFIIERSEKYGGNLEFKSFEELENKYLQGLHPLDLKNSTINYINNILDPIRKYFDDNPHNYNKMKEVGII